MKLNECKMCRYREKKRNKTLLIYVIRATFKDTFYKRLFWKFDTKRECPKFLFSICPSLGARNETHPGYARNNNMFVPT